MSKQQQQGYTAGQYGCAFPFLVITALFVVGLIFFGAKLLGG